MDETYAWAPGGSVDDLSVSGKWLVFCSLEYHADVWKKIKTATEAGELGTQAKTASTEEWERIRTLLDGHTEQGTMSPTLENLARIYKQSTRALLTCVYTHDHTDLDDVRRVWS